MSRRGRSSTSPRRGRAGWKNIGAIGAAALALATTAFLPLAAASPAPALAAQKSQPPIARTYAAKGVSYASATVYGALNPRGQQTEYYFQYGPTSAYGGQTAIAEAGAGTSLIKVSAALEGLSPLTIYHYRLVAVSSAGTTFGSDRSFRTKKVPLSLAIVATPNPVRYGGAVTVEGTLSGTGAPNREIVLEAAPYPFSAFAPVGNTELTSATGSFSFVTLGAALDTEYRVSTTTSPAVVSSVVTEGVSVIVHARHRAVKGRPHHVRVTGTVTPAEDGAHVSVMRLKKGKLKAVGGATLHAHGSNRSSFSTKVYRHPGLYRVYVEITSGSQASTYSAPFHIR